MTHGVSFIDEHRHDLRGGRSAAPIAGAFAAGRAGAPASGRARALRTGRVAGRTGHRLR